MTGPRRALARVRATPSRWRRGAYRLLSPRRTALQVPADRRSPLAHEYGTFGEGAVVVPPALVRGADAMHIGRGVIILERSLLEADAAAGACLTIGDGTRLAPGVVIRCAREVTIGTDVLASDAVSISDSWTEVADDRPGPKPPPPEPVVIEDGAYLGYGCVVGPGVRIGAGAFVGEGAVVTTDVEPHTVVYGNPATVVRRLDPQSASWSGSVSP